MTDLCQLGFFALQSVCILDVPERIPELGDDKAYDGVIPPFVPTKVGLLNPERNTWAMFLRVGEAAKVALIGLRFLNGVGMLLIKSTRHNLNITFDIGFNQVGDYILDVP